ncbi:MAG: hypothetical protein JWQ96_3548 [Segetibacter sp.]|nr:hypothetical protein [Segetibacter sp.]
MFQKLYAIEGRIKDEELSAEVILQLRQQDRSYSNVIERLDDRRACKSVTKKPNRTSHGL